ncbi:MAG: pre-16S rRNA-processing nuclease YqgF [Armatimonadetes bacterium]|nr:pre-16S rRNA-processing nuclease YqgF [Armatimonadota bacterium]
MTPSTEKVVLAVDPGSSKCGMVLVVRTGEGELSLLWRRISPAKEFLQAVDEASAVRPFSMVIVGNGTRSKNLIEELRERMPQVGILVVDERDTTLQARERYWLHNPRSGWRKLLPASMQVPPAPVDDFVALILAERVLVG